MSTTITPKALAAQLGTNGKALRRFMRAEAKKAVAEGREPIAAPVGQGNRYDLSAADARRIASAWRKAHGQPEPKAPKARTPKAVAPVAPVASSDASAS